MATPLTRSSVGTQATRQGRRSPRSSVGTPCRARPPARYPSELETAPPGLPLTSGDNVSGFLKRRLVCCLLGDGGPDTVGGKPSLEQNEAGGCGQTSATGKSRRFEKHLLIHQWGHLCASPKTLAVPLPAPELCPKVVGNEGGDRTTDSAVLRGDAWREGSVVGKEGTHLRGRVLGGSLVVGLETETKVCSGQGRMFWEERTIP